MKMAYSISELYRIMAGNGWGLRIRSSAFETKPVGMPSSFKRLTVHAHAQAHE